MIFGFGKKKSSSSSSSQAQTFVDPSQQPYLDFGRGQARQLYDQGPMPVEGVAGINPNLATSLNNQFTAGNQIANAGGNMMAQGGNMMGQGFGGAMNYANQAMGAGPAQGAGFAIGTGNQYASGTAGMGAASMNAAVNQGFDQSNLSNYINNDVLQGQINAATRDINRNLEENQLTGNASAAAGAGASGSSRRSVMDAIAMRGAADRSADVASQMRGQAYGQALGIEAGRASQNANFQQGANQANAGFQQQSDMFNTRSFNDARRFGTGMGANAFNANTAANQFGANMAFRGGQAGMDMSRTGAGMMGSGLDRAQGSGQYMRDYDQQMENYQYRQGMAPYNSLQFYNQQIGDPNNLSSSTTTSKGKSSGFNLSI